MKKFDYARIDDGINAWTNHGKLRSALVDFSNNIQGKAVSKAGIEKALIGLKVWENGWGIGTRTVTRVKWVGFYETQGLAKAEIFNDGNMNSSVQIHWDPEKNVIVTASKSHEKELEKRVAELEAQVKFLMSRIK